MISRYCASPAFAAEGTRRVYSLDASPLRDIDDWLRRFRGVCTRKLAALAAEIARGKRDRTES